MRSALICVFLTLIVRSQELSEASSASEFRPTPIPLTEWHIEHREEHLVNIEEPKNSGATARYWEDALRHSVYLTLVRDKIDKLIAEGEVILPEKKSVPHISKDIDDHDLWEKIKSAPFDRIRADELDTYGDVTVLAKGRLLQDNERYRFADDGRNREKCYNETCMDGVKAIWSVKRVRQRDARSPSGTNNYELTFSVIPQPEKQQKKPYENPIRTFTVHEKQEQKSLHVVDRPKAKPMRMMWFHKNVVPTPNYHRRNLDRIFSSLFFDDDDVPYLRHYGRQPPVSHIAAPYNHYSKISHAGTSGDQNKMVQHKKPSQPAFKIRNIFKMPWHGGQPNPTVYSSESLHSSPHPSQTKDHNTYVSPIQPHSIKTINIPTTPIPIAVPPNTTLSNTGKENSLNKSDFTTKAPEIITEASRYSTNNRNKTPTKVKYYPHIRPPVYNAPPGVFVTMDKKPFKPMPPIKLIHGKPVKTSRPPDFRPSPQVLDIQFSEPDPFSDTAFRPITVNYDNSNATTESSKMYIKHEDHRHNPTIRKAPKKHENIKAEKTTTSPPEIITAYNEIHEIESTGWNILGALSKTTPMAVAVPQKIQTNPKVEEVTTTTPTPTTTTQPTSTKPKKRTTTTDPTTTTTTPKPTKRTRPPPEFKKDERKEKKSKRRTTTTSTKAPDVSITKSEIDLTPQASSAATSSSKLQKDSTKKPFSTTTTSPTTTNTTINPPTSSTIDTTAFDAHAINGSITKTSTTKNNTIKSLALKVPATNNTTEDDSKIKVTEIIESSTNTLTTKGTPKSTTILRSTTTSKPTTSKASTKATKTSSSKTTLKITSTSTTSTESPLSTAVTESTTAASTTQPKNKNRFRQSTLLQKGTSVKHDKWSLIPASVEKTKNVTSVSGASTPRRKGSNFQGYVSSTPKNTDLDDGENHISSPYISKTSTTQRPFTTKVSFQSDTYRNDEIDNEASASVVYDQNQYPENDVDLPDSLDPFETNGESLSDTSGVSNFNTNDFIYDVLPLTAPIQEKQDQAMQTETSTLPTNKRKCKKKKSKNLTTTSDQETDEANVITSTTILPTTSTYKQTSPTTEIPFKPTASVVRSSPNVTKKARNPDIFETLFGFNFEEEFNLNNTTPELDEEQSEQNVRYLDNPEEKFKFNESDYENIEYEDAKRPILDEGEEYDSDFNSEESKQIAADEGDYSNLEDDEEIDLLEIMGMK